MMVQALGQLTDQIARSFGGPSGAPEAQSCLESQVGCAGPRGSEYYEPGCDSAEIAAPPGIALRCCHVWLKFGCCVSAASDLGGSANSPVAMCDAGNADAYKTLDVNPRAPRGIVKKAFEKLSARLDHDPRRMAKLNWAFDILNDGERRMAYDSGGMPAVTNIESARRKSGYEKTKFPGWPHRTGYNHRRGPPWPLLSSKITLAV